MKILDIKDYNKLQIFLQIYLKIDSINSAFAFCYALKCPDLGKIKHPQMAN